MTLKLWQRYCAAHAALEAFEKTRESNIDKHSYAKDAYFRMTELIFKDENLKAKLPRLLTKEILRSETLPNKKKPHPAELSGKVLLMVTMSHRKRKLVVERSKGKLNAMRRES